MAAEKMEGGGGGLTHCEGHETAQELHLRGDSLTTLGRAPFSWVVRYVRYAVQKGATNVRRSAPTSTSEYTERNWNF